MHKTATALVLLLAACTGPETHPAERAPIDPREAAAAEAPLRGEGRFLVVPRQPDPRAADGPYLTADGDEMVANLDALDTRAEAAVLDVLGRARVPVAVSSGLGRSAVYVPESRAERARRLLVRVPGAAVQVVAADGSLRTAYEVPLGGDAADAFERVAFVADSVGGIGARCDDVLRIAGIPVQAEPRDGGVRYAVPTVRAADARLLLGCIPGAAQVAHDAAPRTSGLTVYRSAPAGGGDRGAYRNVAHLLDLDEPGLARVFGALDRLGVEAVGVSNAGGCTVNVPERDLELARRVLWSEPGARRLGGAPPERGESWLPLGTFYVDGDAGDVRAVPAAWSGPAVEIATVEVRGSRRGSEIAHALHAAGFATSGTAEWGHGPLRLRLTVPEGEAEASRRLLALLGL